MWGRPGVIACRIEKGLVLDDFLICDKTTALYEGRHSLEFNILRIAAFTKSHWQKWMDESPVNDYLMT